MVPLVIQTEHVTMGSENAKELKDGYTPFKKRKNQMTFEKTESKERKERKGRSCGVESRWLCAVTRILLPNRAGGR